MIGIHPIGERHLVYDTEGKCVIVAISIRDYPGGRIWDPEIIETMEVIPWDWKTRNEHYNTLPCIHTRKNPMAYDDDEEYETMRMPGEDQRQKERKVQFYVTRTMLK